MFSVIFPTMWKFEPFLDFVQDIVQHHLVGEVIIVDNDSAARPFHNVLNHHKVRLLDYGRNTFVNPAWNYAVKESSFENLCICNDDVIYDLRIFDRVHPQLTPDVGIIGLSVAPWKEHIVDGIIRVKNYEPGDSQWGFPLTFFMPKQNYVPVPDGLDLFFGDNFVFDSCIWRNLRIMIVKDVWFYTPQGYTTSRLDETMVLTKNVREAVLYRQIIQSVGITDPDTWAPSIPIIIEKYKHLL